MSFLAISTKKWARQSGTAIHAALSLLVFFFLDLTDAILCVVYVLLDEILEGKSQSCYCNASPHTTGENEVSETLFKRRNVFREMGFLGFARRFKLSGRMVKSEKAHRWSDCGCQSCNSWTKNEDGNLHVVVKDSTPQEDSVQEPSENVIFIHGFMGSSYFWTETVFEHVKEDRYRLFAVDLLGFGESPKPRDSLYTLRDHVERIEKSVIEPYQLGSFHVVAHSMGCLIALALAAKHSTIVKSVTLVAPPYFPSSLEESVLTRIAGKRLWPPLAFGTAVMSWEIPWKIKDITRHTHHSAWHCMHNVICGGSKFADKHLETLVNSGVKIHLMQGDRDEMVPLHCSGDMKRSFPAVEVEIVVGADHESVIGGRREEFVEKLESIWEFLQNLDRQILLGVFVAFVAVGAGAGAAYYLSSSKKRRGCLDPENFKEFKLVKKQQLSHNVAKFVFELPTSSSVLGLPIGQHISCRGKDAQGEDVIKPYTPTTLDSDLGRFELVIKMYPQGRMSHHFREMRVGDHLAVKGPKGRFKYQPGQFRAFGMLAGGSGITPMFQVARAILENPTDKTKVHLIYANVTSEDILLKEELESLTANYPDQFKIYYVLNQPPETWDGGVGFVSKEMIQSHCPAPASDIQILRCGPPPMNKAMAANLEALGYSPEMQFQF
ncbi:hypothetical protein YC2023_119534 [Brassica napus]